jgi:fatty acid-binding protein DegV
MPGFCILTDSTVRFITSLYPGQDLVRINPLQVKLENQVYPHGQGSAITNLPSAAFYGKYPNLSSPTIEHFHNIYLLLSAKYSEILTIVHAVALSKTSTHAQLTLLSFADHDSHPMIGSQTTGIGLGWLVEAAVDAALIGTPITVIRRVVCDLLRKIYTLFCMQSLTYLYRSGYLYTAQAIVGEMPVLTTIFSTERGNLVLVQKTRGCVTWQICSYSLSRSLPI